MLNEKNITPSMSFQATMALLCCQNMGDLCDIASCFVSLVFSRAGVVIFNLKVHFIHFTKPDSACVCLNGCVRILEHTGLVIVMLTFCSFCHRAVVEVCLSEESCNFTENDTKNDKHSQNHWWIEAGYLFSLQNKSSLVKSSTFPIMLMPYFLFRIKRLINLLMWNNELCVQHHNFAPKLSQYMIPDDFILTTVQSTCWLGKKDFFSIYGFGPWSSAGCSGTVTERMCMWTNFFFYAVHVRK